MAGERKALPSWVLTAMKSSQEMIDQLNYVGKHYQDLAGNQTRNQPFDSRSEARGMPFDKLKALNPADGLWVDTGWPTIRSLGGQLRSTKLRWLNRMACHPKI